jgi:GGDEF domain-containing protein
MKNIQETPIVSWLSLKDFHTFNKENGWSTGNKVLQELAHLIQSKCKKSFNIYRFYGDNFLILLSREEEFNTLDSYLEKYLKEHSLSYDYKMSHLNSKERRKMESIEDVLKELF